MQSRFLGLALALLLPGVAAAAAATNVVGHLNTDAQWTKSGSPYRLTGDVVVGPGATLTIEPGVELAAQLLLDRIGKAAGYDDGGALAHFTTTFLRDGFLASAAATVDPSSAGLGTTVTPTVPGMRTARVKVSCGRTWAGCSRVTTTARTSTR